MCPPNDIAGVTPATETETGPKAGKKPPRRVVGAESEARGGPEAPDETLDSTAADHATPARKGGA